MSRQTVLYCRLIVEHPNSSVVPEHFIQALPLHTVLELEGRRKFVQNLVAQTTEVYENGQASDRPTGALCKAQNIDLRSAYSGYSSSERRILRTRRLWRK